MSISINSTQILIIRDYLYSKIFIKYPVSYHILEIIKKSILCSDLYNDSEVHFLLGP